MNIGDSVLIIDGPWEGTAGVIEDQIRNGEQLAIAIWNNTGLLYVLSEQIIPINVKDNPEHFI